MNAKPWLCGLRWRIDYRVRNRLLDARAVISGYCNHSPWTERPDGGYSFWRCGHKRRHNGPHRYRNYTWTEPGPGDYAPVKGDGVSQPWERHACLTMRQQRRYSAWLRQADAELGRHAA